MNIKFYLSVLIAIVILIIPHFLFSDVMSNDITQITDKSVRAYTYVTSNILVFFIVCPFFMQYFPQSYNLNSQIWANLAVLVLDWGSLHQDKSRFSEAEECLFGNCRKNALWTGIIAHLGDAIGVLMLITLNIQTNMRPLVILAGIAYIIGGSFGVYFLTKDGSDSDLRNLNEEDKCKRNRIMKDKFRGVLNLVITFLGVMVAWQVLMEIGNPGKTPHDNMIFTSFLKEAYHGFKGLNPMELRKNGNGYPSRKVSYAKLANAILTLVLAIVPTYANQINTGFQYAADSKLLQIPDCFD